jgi:hypothetical protein
LLTLGVGGMVLAKNGKDAAAIIAGLSPERRAVATAVNVQQAAELIGTYIDAGFGGFTFNNNVLQTEEALGLAGELIKVVRGSAVPS